MSTPADSATSLQACAIVTAPSPVPSRYVLRFRTINVEPFEPILNYSDCETNNLEKPKKMKRKRVMNYT
jgi:hypothetical protein